MGVAKINVETHSVWDAVDHDGEVLERLVTKSHDCAAALNFSEVVDGTARSAGRNCQRPITFRGAGLKELGRGDEREMARNDCHSI